MVGDLTTVVWSVVRGWWSVVGLSQPSVDGWWFLRSVVGGSSGRLFLDKWSVAGDTWSVVGATVVGSWSVGGCFVPHRFEERWAA